MVMPNLGGGGGGWVNKGHYNGLCENGESRKYQERAWHRGLDFYLLIGLNNLLLVKEL